MNKITFKSAVWFHNRPLDHLVKIIIITVDCFCLALLVDWLLTDLHHMLPFIITSLVLACLFEGLSAYGKTVVDLDKRLIKHTPAATFPPVLIGIDDIDSITCRKYWFYNNLKITTKAGKKTFKISVDDPKRFIEALTTDKQTADNQ